MILMAIDADFEEDVLKLNYVNGSQEKAFDRVQNSSDGHNMSQF